MPFGVSNSFKRGTVKTYTRQKAHLENSNHADRPRKRICMDVTAAVVEARHSPSHSRDEEVVAERSKTEDLQHAVEERASSVTAPSSPPPPDRSLFSSDALSDESELSSPPSSPPMRLPSPVVKARKPTFSLLKRKRSPQDHASGSLPLCDITHNARKAPAPPRSKKSMTQLRIDLGGDSRKTCRMCGMEYVPSVKEDAALHKEFCGMNLGGVEMGKAFLRDESIRRVRSEMAMAREKESVIMVDRKSSPGVRSKARKVLEVVNAELAAADINEEQLWASLPTEVAEKRHATRLKKVDEGIDNRGTRFKAFLYLIEDRCVGFCLAEKITNAFPVVASQARKAESSDATRSSSISVSNTAAVALVGISRIWISKSQRGRGLAMDLLDCARGNFFYGIEVPKNLVAFSQPTESGGQLAERWFGSETSWHVYRDKQ